MFETAKWIWSGEKTGVNDYARFRTVFRGEAGEARVRISVDQEYALLINGGFVGCGQYADYAEYKVYDEYAVNLRAGENVLEVTAYCSGEDFFTYRKGSAALLFEVEQGGVIAASGGDTEASPATAYRSGPIEKITNQLGFSFDYDAGFAPGGWGRAVPVGGPRELHPRPVKKLTMLPEAPAEILAVGAYREDDPSGTPAQRMQRAWLSARPPRREKLPSAEGCLVEGGKEGTYALIDLFREEAGLFAMDIEVDEPCEILIGWGEQTEDLRLRTSVGGRNFGARYMARAGRQRFTHYFRRLGLRYVQLFAAAGKIRIYYAGLLPTPYPLREMALDTSDRLHDEIARVSARTLHLCMHEHYEDCPWREQALYAMDSRNQMLCGYYAFGEYDMPKSSLRLLGLSLREDGMLEICAPARARITIPSFTAMYVVELMEYVLFSGDLDFGREMLPTARKICEGFLAHRNENGLMEAYQDRKYWNFYEWRPYLEGYQRMDCDNGRREDAPLTAFTCLALNAMSRLMDMLGLDGGEWERACREMGRAAHAAFWDEKEGAYASFRGEAGRFHFAELTQALMLLSGGAPEEIQPALRARLLTGEGLVPATTAYTVFKFDALLADPAYGPKVMDQVTRDWGRMLFAGATAFWETMDGARDFDDAGSLCHGWSAVPLYLYFRYALGLYPTAPGFEEYEIAPVECGLGRPRGRVVTRGGRTIELGEDR